jgi:hypothetical protein
MANQNLHQNETITFSSLPSPLKSLQKTQISLNQKLSTANLQMNLAHGHVIPTTNVDCGGRALLVPIIGRRHRFPERILTTKRQPLSESAAAPYVQSSSQVALGVLAGFTGLTGFVTPKEILIFRKVFIAFCAGKFIVRRSINLKDDQFT